MRSIPTRLHGALDYASAAGLLLLAGHPDLPMGLQRPVAAAGIATVGYSSVTRYEWGVCGLLPMRQHLRLDAAQGILFCGAGIFGNDAPSWVRRALLGYGLFALAAAVLTAEAPTDHHAL